MVEARTLSGFRDRLPRETLIKHDIIEKVVRVFRSFGFAPIETPHLEYADILVKQGSEEIQKELYRFRDHGDRDVALRFDQTIPLARFISQHRSDITLPFKRYAIGNVFRGERAQKGRYREFTQCDFDFIGSDSIGSDAEIVQVIKESLYALLIKDFTILLNNRKIINGFASYLGLGDKIEDILRVVDKIEKIGIDRVKEELSLLEIESGKIEKIIEFVSQKGIGAEFFKSIECYKDFSEESKQGIEELEFLCEILSSLEIDKRHYKIDFSIARGLGYYTGIVYETLLDKQKDIGSICSGGRYDNLTQNFSKEKTSGVGASIGIDRLIAALEDDIEQKETPAIVLIIVLQKEFIKECYRVGEKLRSFGINTEVFPEALKAKKQFAYANKKGHCYTMPVGESEIKNGIFTIKNMKNGEQQEVSSIEDIAKIIKK